MGAIRPVPDESGISPCRITKARPFLNAATATVFGSGLGVPAFSPPNRATEGTRKQQKNRDAMGLRRMVRPPGIFEIEVLHQFHFDSFIPGTSHAEFLAIFFEDPIGSLHDGS
jgi:hypothetical protein